MTYGFLGLHFEKYSIVLLKIKKMKSTLLLLLFGLLLISISLNLNAQIINVPQDYPSIQSAINSAVENDTVLVAPGEYFENINFNGKNIVLCSNYAFSGNPEDISATVINGSTPIHADTGSCVLIVSGEDSTAVIQGFTITGGTGTKWEDEHGPGTWYTEGGGILIQYSSPTIINNMITVNEAINNGPGIASAGGGAIRCGDGNPHILNNVISFNQGLYGGGIVLNYSGAVIRNNLIFGNSGGNDFGGGGLWLLFNGDFPIIIENNTIVANHSALGGGGIRFYYTTATATNNIIWGNTANFADQIQGTGSLSFCCVEGGYNGEGNIESDPEFTEESYILTDSSPCIDAGTPDENYNDPEDPMNLGYALFPARGTLTSDMGAYGGPGCIQLSSIITAINHQGQNNETDFINIYPNPATSLLSISINATINKDVEFQIFDAYGSLVKQEKIQIHHKESHTIDISMLEPAIYLLNVKVNDMTYVLKFIKQ